MSSGRFDVLVVGGGASGMAAAIAAKQTNPRLSVAIVEKGERMGRKLALTGNGRCNISNVNAIAASEVNGFLENCGVLLRKDEEDRLYPYSEDAGQVAAYFAELVETLGVEIFLNTEVKKVEACPDGGFLLLVDGLPTVDLPAASGQCESSKELWAEKVVLATGGKSYPKTGSTGDGYVIARALGHSVSPLRPALVPVCVELASDGQDYSLKNLAGVRAKARVHLLEKDRVMCSTRGEIQFREDSISGICILNLSMLILPHDSLDREGYADYEISIDFMPDTKEQELRKYFEKCGVNEHALRTMVKGKLARALLDLAGSEPAEIARILKDFRLQVTGLKGWKEAQVTGGGVSKRELNHGTMESKIVPGIFITGEVVDFAGDCGGFNLAFAWMTGSRAGRAAAE